MGLVDISPALLEVLEKSTCFGIAHDDSVPECKRCDVKAQCKAKMEGSNVGLPPLHKSVTSEKPKKPTTTKSTTSKSTKPSKPTESKTTNKKDTQKKTKKESTPNVSGMPNFKDMLWEDLVTLAQHREVPWKDYGNPNINRMRIIMALKKSYK